MPTGRGPLDGISVGLGAAGRPYAVAAGLLSGLGAVVGDNGAVVLGGPTGPGARLIPAPGLRESGRGPADEGLPGGTLDHATGVALATAALAGWRSGSLIGVSELGVAIEVWLPEVMAAAYASPTAMRPRPPVAAPGGGWLNLDLGAGGDAADYERLLGTLDADTDAAAVAAAAQEWRLPVCDYRRAGATPLAAPLRVETGGGRGVPSGRPGRSSAAAGSPAGDLRVCDLTTMWAGPLATRLLQDLGAEILKVEPGFRPDGMRAVAGGGIHPGGVQVEPGRDSAMWNALNTAKHHVDLDLRDPEQKDRFVALASTCDVVIDSFSPRVMPNFGVEDRLRNDPLLVSMPAFPPGPLRHWVAYGTGVHAVAGLGRRDDGAAWAPAVSYPDPLAGLTGALAVMAGVVARQAGVAVRRVEATLAGAVGPLTGRRPPVPVPGGGSSADTGRRVGAVLLEMGRAEGLMVGRRVAGRDLLHPSGPFRPLPASAPD